MPRRAGFFALLRGSERVGAVVVALGILTAGLLVATELSTVAAVDLSRDVGGTTDSCEVINDASPERADRCELSGVERHGGAFFLLAVVALLMAVGAGPGRSRPAALALMAIGIVVAAITLIGDLPKTSETGLIGRVYADAEGKAGTGFYMEIAAALTAIAAGALALTRRRQS